MDQVEEKLLALATDLGLTDMLEMKGLRLQIIEANNKGDEDLYKKYFDRYRDLERLILDSIPELPKKRYINAQYAISIMRLCIAYVCNGTDGYTAQLYYDLREDLDDNQRTDIWERIEKIFS